MAAGTTAALSRTGVRGFRRAPGRTTGSGAARARPSLIPSPLLWEAVAASGSGLAAPPQGSP
eukprot:8691744-Prorocentrum_lima.AAC.1